MSPIPYTQALDDSRKAGLGLIHFLCGNYS